VPIYVYVCPACAARAEVFVRRIGGESAVLCAQCGSAEMQRIMSSFATTRDLASELAGLDPKYRKRIDEAIARTPEADPMRLLSKLTPFSAADGPGDPVRF
jgi:putative FmdB family regulatory protein